MEINGNKTRIGAGLSILFGVAGLLLGTLDARSAAQFITQGIIALGIGHKLEKATKAG